MPTKTDGVPVRCECGAEWVWRQVWWDSPSENPRWGYLVYCEARHFRWFECDVPAADLEHAKRRFGVRREEST